MLRKVVLIETYWNVNFLTASEGVITNGINRNILECKSVLCVKVILCFIVLIETYWNVNSVNTDIQFRLMVVLIETYWNVNLV